MEVHWSKVEDGPCVVVESHVPPYVGDDDLAGPDKSLVVGLFRDGEEPAEPADESRNVWAAESYADREEEVINEYWERQE